MKKTTLTLLALVFTILVATSTTTTLAKVKVPALPHCVNYYSGVGQDCSTATNSDKVCLGDTFCAEETCHPKQIFNGEQCTGHHECFRGFEYDEEAIARTHATLDRTVLNSHGVYCDLTAETKSERKCKFTRENNEACTQHYQCQSNRCIDGFCSLINNGTACESTRDCYPFNGELLHCDPVHKLCLAKRSVGDSCDIFAAECGSGSYCYNSVCTAYRNEGESCSNTDKQCRPSFDNSDNSLDCRPGANGDDICQYPAKLRERYQGSRCIEQYAEYEEENTDYGICDKKSCYSDGHYNCETTEFCDCTNNVCMNKGHGNKVHECDFENGFRSAKSDAFVSCLQNNCPNTVFSSNTIMLNKESCAYAKCRPQYLDIVKCKREASREYGATKVFFFGAGTGAASLAQLSPVVAALLVIVNIAYAMF